MKRYVYFIPSTGEFDMVDSWDECKEKVNGVSGAKYKSVKGTPETIQEQYEDFIEKACNNELKY